MSKNKKATDLNINRFFGQKSEEVPVSDSKTPPPAPAGMPTAKKLPTSFRVDPGHYDDLKILKWKLVLPSMTASVNRALREFIEAHRAELDEAKTQLGEEGIRDLLSRRD